MAGTRTVTDVQFVNGSTVTSEYAFDYDDTWDGYDWTLPPPDLGYRDPSGLSLTSAGVTVTVVGGDVSFRYFRMQGNSKRPWREGVLGEGNTPVAFPTTGGNPRTVGDLVGAEVINTGMF